MVNRFSPIFDALFPQVCRLCGLRSGCTLPLCQPCRSSLTPNTSACQRCALPLPAFAAGDNHQRVCGRCLQKPPAFDRVRAPWLYDDTLAALITPWKYQRDQRLTPLLADLMLAGIPADPSADRLVAVPLHWRRLMWRGFNQSQELAIMAARKQNYLRPSHPHFQCRRQRYSPPQSGQGARQRSSLPRDTFTVQGRCDNLRIALVDDVLTTGATADALADRLKAAGAETVEVWCIARTPPPETGGR